MNKFKNLFKLVVKEISYIKISRLVIIIKLVVNKI